MLVTPYSFWLHLIAFLLNLPDFIPVLADSVQVILIAFRLSPIAFRSYSQITNFEQINVAQMDLPFINFRSLIF